MNESTATSGAQVIAAGISSVTLAIFGLSYLSLLWAFIGAVAILVFTPPEKRGVALLAIGLSGLVGAALGTAIAKFLGGGDSALIAASLICGAGAKPLLSTLIEAGQAAIRRKGDSL